MNGAYLFPNPFSGHRDTPSTDNAGSRGKRVTFFECSHHHHHPSSHFYVSYHHYTSLQRDLHPHIASTLPMTSPPYSCPKFFFTHAVTESCFPPTNHPELSDLSHESMAVLKFASFLVQVLCVRQRHAPLGNHRHHCSTCNFFFILLSPSPRNASPKSALCKVRPSFTFSSIKLILSSVILTLTLSGRGWARTPTSSVPPIFFHCFSFRHRYGFLVYFMKAFGIPCIQKTRRLCENPFGAFSEGLRLLRRVSTMPPA